MRILYLCTFYHRAMLFRQQMDALNERGHDARVFSSAEYGEGVAPKFEPLMDDLVRHYECWNKLDRLLFFPRQFKIERKLEESYDLREFDLIHSQLMLSSGYTAMRMKRKYGTRYVVTVRATDLSGFIRFPTFKSLAKKILTEASGILFLSPVHKNVLFDLLGDAFASTIAHKCQVIGNCVEKFWEDNQYVMRTGPTTGKEVKLLAVAKIRPVKNLCAAAEAVQELRRRGYSATLTVIGENQDSREYERIRAFECVSMAPFMAKEELIDAYRTHDVFLLPSKEETFGRVYVEAMTQGLPVLYTRGQGFDGNYEDGFVGYSVDANDSAMIADRVESVLTRYPEISQNCIERCSDFFEDVVTDKLERFLEQSVLR